MRRLDGRILGALDALAERVPMGELLLATDPAEFVSRVIAMLDSRREAQLALEQMPCGGVGAGGPELGELLHAAEAGRVVCDDAVYHHAQLAWRLLDEGACR